LVSEGTVVSDFGCLERSYLDSYEFTWYGMGLALNTDIPSVGYIG